MAATRELDIITPTGRIVSVTVDPLSVSPPATTISEAEDYMDTNFSGWTLDEVVLPVADASPLGYWLLQLFTHYLVMINERQNATGVKTYVWTVTEP